MPNARGENTILVVDDEFTIAESLRAIFIKAGFEARAAFSAEEALQIVSSWQPDVALLDVMLPAMNGVDLAVMLSATLPNCRVVLFSGSLQTETLLEAAAKDGHRFDILPKPIHPAHMLDFISSLLGESGMQAGAEPGVERGSADPETSAPEPHSRRRNDPGFPQAGN